MSTSSKKIGFPPIVGKQPKQLILGSMPGQRSLDDLHYYAHPRNAFWFIMDNLFDIPENTSYEDKLKHIKNNGIALWDVLRSCERKGSLDASIQNSSIEVNDFHQFLQTYPEIELIAFNGAKAHQEFVKRVRPALSTSHQQIKTVRLPSTSPAMAALKKEEKLTIWKAALKPH